MVAAKAPASHTRAASGRPQRTRLATSLDISRSRRVGSRCGAGLTRWAGGTQVLGAHAAVLAPVGVPIGAVGAAGALLFAAADLFEPVGHLGTLRHPAGPAPLQQVLGQDDQAAQLRVGEP